MWVPLTLAAAASFAVCNVAISVLVRHEERHPLVLTWYLSVGMIVIFSMLPILLDVRTPWALPLATVGSISYLGVLLYCHALDRMDVSVSEASWGILAILISLSSFLIFGETWSPRESLGAVLVLSGVFCLLFWNRHLPFGRTAYVLIALSLPFLPSALIQKAALESGQGAIPVFFWSTIGRELLGCTVPLLLPRCRREVTSRFHRLSGSFIVIVAVEAVTASLGWFLTVAAYANGPLSLVSVVSNVQPFFVIVIAWITANVCPLRAPRELLTAQSIGVKIGSFFIVFAGIALIAL